MRRIGSRTFAAPLLLAALACAAASASGRGAR